MHWKSSRIRVIVVLYALDTDNSTASDIAPVDKNKYEDDFDFTDATLTFSPITYTYNSVSGSYSKNEGENPKSISIDIYNDDLYELDETIIINLTEGGFENAATDGGDHSFTYTLQNDDPRPIPNWVDNYSIDEANPSDVNADSYTNSDVKVTLDRSLGQISSFSILKKILMRMMFMMRPLLQMILI